MCVCVESLDVAILLFSKIEIDAFLFSISLLQKKNIEVDQGICLEKGNISFRMSLSAQRKCINEPILLKVQLRRFK